jgi:alpha,alpha-trehalose phosphorylase
VGVLKREVVPPPEHLFPADEWRIVETAYSPLYWARAETAFALSNGYLGVRGSVEEGRPAHSPGTFLNGFHETWPIVHPETAYGLAQTGQTIVNVPDGTCLKLYVDDEPLFLPVARMQRYERVLDMRAGTLCRHLVWSTPSGKHVRVRTSRLVSLESRHLLAMSFEVTMLDHGAPVVLSSQLVNRQDVHGSDGPELPPRDDPRLGRRFDHRVLLQRGSSARALRAVTGYRTARSGMGLAVGVDHVVECATAFDVSTTQGQDESAVTVVLDAEPGVPLTVTKYVAYS